MKFRLANKSDASALARVHYKCSKRQKGSFLYELGYFFLKIYYLIHLQHKNGIILVAEDEQGIHGFVSGTFETQELLERLRKNRIKLFLATLPALVKSPGILTKLIARYNFVHQKTNAMQFGITQGPKIDYWAWDPDIKENVSVILFKKFLNIVFAFGLQSIKGEIDEDNNNIISLHKHMGARVIQELNMENNRKRLIIEYLNDKKQVG